MARLIRRPSRGRSTSRRRTYLIGVAGHPNFGDEAITRGWLRWLATHRPDDEVWLDVPNPAGAAALHHGEHPHLVTVDTVHRLGWETPSSEGPADGAAVVAHTRAVLDEPWRAPRWLAGLEALRAADTVHVLGGGFVHAHHPHTASLLAALEWAARHGSRTAISGAGLVPADPALADLLGALGEAVDVATVRDPGSAAALPGSVLAPDDVWLGGIEQHLAARDADAPQPEVMVLVQGDGHSRGDELAATVLALLDAWGVGAGEYAVVEANPPVDGYVRAALEAQHGPHRFHSFAEIATHGLPARAGQRWITTRYHPHLLAAAAGADGVAISVSGDYYDVKHQAVRSAGSAWPVLAIGDAPVAAGPAGSLPERRGELAATLEATARAIHGDVLA